ncbi:MAG: uncharacterized protein H6R26_2776 [Proteobacteria bacterium]|nr:uncharacterized protein [Pseudomonadota bacterium]
MFFLLKLGITALVIVGAAEVAKRSTWLGGLLVALPLVSILSMTWLYVETRDSAKVAEFAREILIMVPPSLLFFVPFLLEPRTHWPFWLNCAVGCAITSLGMYAVATWRAG